MTSAAHTAVLVHLLALLDTVPYLVIRRAQTAPGELGTVDFDENLVTVSAEADLPEFVVTLMHEVRHLRRGPCYEGDEEVDEAVVVDETTRLLVPDEALPEDLDTVDPRKLAAALGIDVQTARHAIALARQDRTSTIGKVA
ncbi:hypothetical protein [Umezawaea tangerina]|uniref:IrrE N-terminal-like domain-containing protein n=1 Tax=Umezawaea tangerina TaxID=84725 RepID=A0A2T0SPC6_9PSEU|nr:hypothetical protein [Umezawaea tangerina]PRY35271.1 hypothetical protein CLV43_114189 [Umezawaea tangerina]